MEQTPDKAKTIFGDKLYQQRAREALPILVRQAKVRQPILYSDISQELGMSNARNMNYVLGSIGNTIIELSKKWKTKIPAIECLVINKQTGLPGDGIEGFVAKDYSKLSPKDKERIVREMLKEIFDFDKWDDVLRALKLPPMVLDFSKYVEKHKTHVGGEGHEHKALKMFIAKNPNILGLKCSEGEIECLLLSGDKLDVSFRQRKLWIGIEVKSVISNSDDILRGIFQCVKYKTVMEAMQTVIPDKYGDGVKVILAIESKLPKDLIKLKNTLNVEVIENVKILAGSWKPPL